jgi:protein-tyrosine phosphatase
MFRSSRRRHAHEIGSPDAEGSASSAGVAGFAGASALDLSWITDTLAIGGSFAPNQTEALARDHLVAAVVDVRGEECDDEALLAKHGIELLHLPTMDFEPISPRLLSRGIAFVTAHLAEGRRVLVHCAEGIGRSALLGLCVLVESGHAPLNALVLAKARRSQVSPSRSQYEAWASWLAGRRTDRGDAWIIPTFDQFRAIVHPRRR